MNHHGLGCERLLPAREVFAAVRSRQSAVGSAAPCACSMRSARATLRGAQAHPYDGAGDVVDHDRLLSLGLLVAQQQCVACRKLNFVIGVVVIGVIHLPATNIFF